MNNKANDELIMKYREAQQRVRQINLELFLAPPEDRKELLNEKADLVKYIKQNWGKVNG